MERWYIMKNKLIYFILIIMTLVLPIHANNPYKLSLNDIPYTPQHTPMIVGDTLFLALEDLADMTYSSYTSKDQEIYTWPLQGTTLIFSPNSRVVNVSSKKEQLSTEPRLLNDTLYVPVSLLDLANYPYTLSSDLTQFELTALLPYSSSTDTYESHDILHTHYDRLKDVFEPLVEDYTTLLQSAVKSNQYLSFASGTYKKELVTKIKTLCTQLPTLEVTFRNFDLLKATPTSHQLVTYPLTVTPEENGIRLKFNNQNILYQCFWPTYNPSRKDTSIDINKTLDVMIMRTLYENYRDTYDLKDDIHFSPITTVQMGRSDAITFTVYSDHIMDKTHTYTVTLYKHITPGKINYIVDLAAHPITPTE